jgi:putative PEP-CTERM system TPR-repeat lipoprotein
MTPSLWRASLPIAVLAALIVAGCGGPDPKDLVASAKDYLAKSDTKAAIIQLRNARQQAPNDAETRFLLGRAYLESGDPTAAEVELRRALDFKYPPQQVLPLIAQALVAQGEHRKVVAEFAEMRIADPRARADIATTVAIAALAQGDIRQTQDSLKIALAADPKYARAHVASAKLAMRGGETAAAKAALDTALAASPNDVEASVMRAEMLALENRSDEAIAMLGKTAAAHPNAPQVRYTLIAMLVNEKKIDQAEAALAALKKDAPNDFRTGYSEALVLLAKNEPAKAREITDKLVAARPDHTASLYLSAMANYQLKGYAAAEDALQKVIVRAPNDPAPRRLLVATYVRTGRAAQAIEAAEIGLRRTPNDPMLLRLAGEARMLTGNIAEATRLYEQAAAADREGGGTARLRLAQIRLATGDADRGMAELSKLALEDSTTIQPELALFGAHLRKREYDKALAVVNAIDKQQPGKALTSDLRGNVYVAKYDLKEARKHYMKAIEIEPNRLSSIRSLALIDLQEGKVADARARYDKLIAAEPKNEAPLLAYAEILALTNAPATEVKAALERAVAANTSAVGPRLALVTHYRRVGDDKAALEAARAAATALPNEPRLVELYGVMQLAAGEAKSARETFARLTQLSPQSPAPWLRVAEAHIANRDFASAIDAQRRALTVQPDYTPALVALATTYLMSGKPDDAVAEARRLQRERPKAGAGYALEAELYTAQKKYPEALAAMREAIARDPSPAFASRQYGLLVAAGRAAEANAFADKWIKDHPKDAGFLSLVAQQRQAAKDNAAAERYYRAAMEIEPENVVVLNNLAWLLNEQGRPEARELAERAYRLAPLSPMVVDTLGAVALRQGDTARALALMRQATSISPQDARLRINLARALVKSGDKAAAKRELEQVVSREKRAPLKAEAEQLLKEL